MAKFKLYKLRFSALHLGDERADYDKSNLVYHSDSMYAAITSALAKVGTVIPDNGDFGFSISSLFPFYQRDKESKTVYFLPRILKQDAFEPGLRKKVKKIAWLDLPSYTKYIHGEPLFEGRVNESSMKGNYSTSEIIDEDFISSNVNPRVVISRDGSEDAKPFYMERLFFKEGSGLYFMATGETQVIDRALEILQDEGIGTDRTIGNGFFECETDMMEMILPKSETISNLSMFIPETKEQLKVLFETESLAYHFQKRGGWITDAGLNTYRKNNIYMFDEGGVFNYIEKIDTEIVLGKVVNLKPTIEHVPIKHPIYRDGRALFIPVVK